MHPELDKLIEMALADGQVTDKEREIILRKAEKLSLDVDEVEIFYSRPNERLQHYKFHTHFNLTAHTYL